MKTINAAVALAMILLGFVASGSAMAGHYGRGGYYGHGGGVRFSIGVGVGVPFGWYSGYYGYYPPPYYAPYYPPVVTAPYAPPTYVEQGSPQTAPAPQAVPAPQGFWYYCADSKAYYPYVNQCPSGWQRVSPTPPPG
jgi:hypothetical protein